MGGGRHAFPGASRGRGSGGLVRGQRGRVLTRSIPLSPRHMTREGSMLRIPRDQFTYQFSARSEPVATVAPGDQFVVETHDTSTGRIHRAEDVPDFVRVRDPLKVNPAAGPIFVEGATPGD